MVVLDHPEEALEIGLRVGSGEFKHSVNPRRQWRDTLGIDAVAKVGQLCGSKDTFGPIDHQTIGGQELEDLTQMVSVVLVVLAGHQYVIKVDKCKRNFAKYTIHQPLKCLSSVLEAEGHTKELP